MRHRIIYYINHRTQNIQTPYNPIVKSTNIFSNNRKGYTANSFFAYIVELKRIIHKISNLITVHLFIVAFI